MSNAAKLRKKAAEFEALKQFDRAIVAYVRAIQESESEGEEIEVAILNKVGDLTLRQGRVADAVTYYERAIEHYATAGLFNNAIALCNKVLRSAPGRSNVYYTLGRICARKGLRGDATRNFLEYATRMQQDGRVDEGMRALAEVADLMPELTEVRRLVDEHAIRAGITLPRRRTPVRTEAQPEDPPRAGQGDKSANLVFLDVEYDAAAGREATMVVDAATPMPSRATGTGGRNDPARAAAPAPARPTPARASLDDIMLFDPTTADPSEFDDGADDGSELGTRFGATSVDGPGPVADAADAAESADGVGAADTVGAEPLAMQPAVDTAMPEREPGSAPSLELLSMASLVEPPASVTPLDGLVSSGEYGDVDVEPLEGFTADDGTLEALGGSAADAEAAADAVEGAAGSTRHFRLEEAPAPVGDYEDSLMRGDDADDDDAHVVTTSPLPDVVTEDFDMTSDDPAVSALLGPEATGHRGRTPITPITPLGVVPIPELEAAIADGALAAARGGDDGPATRVEARPPFRLDPHDFILPGELPPLVLDDAFVQAGMGLTAPADEPPAARRSTATPSVPIASVAAEANAVALSRRDSLRAAVADTPRDWMLRRRLAEALFEAGERDAGLAELDTALNGLVENEDLAGAADIADELIRVAGEHVPYHQRRVELAVRLHDQQRLRSAYLDLADTLVHAGDEGRARAVYARVLEIDPRDERARTALGQSAPPLPDEAGARPDDQFVDLAQWLRDDDPSSTRMRMREPVVSGDEQADFDALLRHFKEGVSRSLGEDDYDSHYDLGVAYKEMGLLDDAIAEFQKALRSRSYRLPAYEALGQCFVEQARFDVAATVLSRALHEPGLTDEQRVGVLYLLAYSSEALERWSEARSYYQRVYATDIHFRDAAARLAAIDQAAR